MKTINVAQIINKDLAITATDGQLVFEELSDALKNTSPVVIDFSGIKLVISAFLNAATGQLYREYNSDFLNANLQINGLSEDDMNLLKSVNERAKIFYGSKREELTNVLDEEFKNE